MSVVVPVFGNAERLGELVERLARALTGSYELLFVDDASPDDARSVLRRLAALNPRVCGLGLASNVGQNAAVVAGLAHARGDVVVVMDADLQDPPEAVPLLLRELDRNDADVVFAGRRGRYEPMTRLVGSRLLKRLLWVLTRAWVPADAGLFVAVRRTVSERVCASAGSNPYVVVLIAQSGQRIVSVPVERTPSIGSAYSARARLRVARHAVASALRGDSGPNTYRVAERIGACFGSGEVA